MNETILAALAAGAAVAAKDTAATAIRDAYQALRRALKRRFSSQEGNPASSPDGRASSLPHQIDVLVDPEIDRLGKTLRGMVETYAVERSITVSDLVAEGSVLISDVSGADRLHISNLSAGSDIKISGIRSL